MSCGTLIGLALSGAGAGASEYAAQDENSAMNQQVANQLAQQAAYQKQGSKVFDTSLGQSTPQSAKQQVQQGQQQELGAIQNAQAAPLALAAAPMGDTATEKAQQKLGNDSNSQFTGYGNFGFQQGLKDQTAANQLGVINNNARSSASILPIELQSASQQDSGLSALGSLLGTAGLLTGVASGTGAFNKPQIGSAGISPWATSQQASPLWLGQVAPQQPNYYNFLTGGF